MPSARISPTSLRLKLFVSLFAIALLLPSLLSAQAYFGTVSGELTDSSGAMVPDAKILLTDQQKGFSFTTTSDSNGRYLFRSVPPGVYVLAAEVKGFEKIGSKPFNVDINQNATTNLSLKVAGATQTIQVQAQAQAIQTEDAETGQVVNRKFINDLPLISRNVVDLTSLAPGVTEMDDQCGASCTGTNFVSNGSRGSTSDILADGASVTNSEPNGGITAATYLPSPEAVEEFKVEQTNFSAEYGFSGGSVVNLITRSGTNSFHGSGYDFVRDQSLDSNNWFNNHYGVPIPQLRRNNYGGTFGGPLIKNKTFFFFDYDGLRANTLGSSQAGVPSAAMRTGDFGEVCTSQGGTFDTNGLCSVPAGQIWDPYLRTYDSTAGGPVAMNANAFIPFNNIATYASPGNPNVPNAIQANVPGNLIDPVAMKMLSYFPKPNIQGNGIYDNWIGSGPNHSNNDQFDIKVDHRFNDKNMMSVKYSQQWSSSTSFNCFGNFTDPCQGGPNKTTAHLFAINDTHTITPTLLLNTTLGFTRGAWHIDAYNPQGVNDPLGTLGFPPYLGVNGFKGVPAIFIGQYFSAGYTSIGTDPYGNYRLGQDTGQLTSTLDKVHGPHEIKFGFDGRIHQINYIQTNAPLGFFTFNEHGSDACPSGIESCGGDAMASFLMGQMTQGCGGNGCGTYYEIQTRPATTNYQYGFFALDNWKVNPKLTLNLGLRYDVTLPRTDRYNRQNWFDPNATSPLAGGSLTYDSPVTGQPVTMELKGGEVFATSAQRKNYVTDWHDIQPRFGFAYQFAPKMVVRGGYGIYYGQSRSGVTGVVPFGNAGFNQYTYAVSTYQNDGATPYLHLSNPFPNGLIQPAGSSLGLMNDVGFGANGPLRTLAQNRTPQEQSWSLGVERQFPWNVVLNAEYIGKKGTHLPFSGTSYGYMHLGPWIESLPVNGPDPNNPCATFTVSCVNSYVNNPFASVITDPNSTLSSPQVQYAQLLEPYPQFTSVSTDAQMIASSIYHGLQLLAEKRFSNGLQFLATYTWSKSIDDSSQADDNVTWLGSFSSLQDPNKPWVERSLSTFDIPHVIQLSYSYDLPLGRNRLLGGNMPRWADALIGGWKTNGIWRIADGRPLTFTVADGVALPTYGGQRPNLVGAPRKASHDIVDQYFADINVFQRPADYTMGNAPRAYGGLRSPWSFSTDLSVAKLFAIREAMNLELRIEAQNAFNHPVFGTPNTSFDDPSFGQISYTSIGPREVQLAIKFNF